ncbi:MULTISPECIES: glutathione S-transferase N-terminal domain-containing protein [unclassified Halomonas]|uniref:glutathione S-transferase N-terminal domain-containing protein n=1 Tax=unclassified Halomonas TaxID=2609666 RepID=UPI0024686EF5|nr:MULTISPECIES: glutathione S-transferase N-terminal domain-containing protein [unclassified Halomonas]
MELFLNATSPYARMVRIVVLEMDLAEAVTLRWCDPWGDESALLEANPAGRIPALVTEEGTTLSESLLIATYLNALGQSETVIPSGRLNEVLHLAGLGQSLMDAAFTTVISRKHHGKGVDDSVLGRRRWRAMQRILERLESELNESQVSPAVTLGDISIAVALDYLAFRLPELDWASSHPQLQAWHRLITGEESFQQTVFE